MRLALVAALLAFVSATALAVPPRITHDTVLPEVFYLDIERDGVREATFVQPRADGMVAFTAPDGTVDYVPLYRVRRIANQDGLDLTTRLRRREWLGTAPPRSDKPVKNEPWKPYRFRSGPGTVCGSYLITDFAELPRLGVNTYANREERFYESADLGYAKNVGSASSLGGTLFFGADGARVQAGLRIRLSRWLSRSTSVDLSPGIILLANEEGDSQFGAPGFAGQVGLMVGGRFGVTAQMFSARRKPLGYERSITENAWNLGFRLGAEPGIACSSMFLFAAAISGMNAREFRPSLP